MDSTLNKLPFVSIIIPCRNEEKYIGMCLNSILANDYPKEWLEVLIVDGISKEWGGNILTP
jgi:glycosyltransferase involved in cell wall biosynthesis